MKELWGKISPARVLTRNPSFALRSLGTSGKSPVLTRLAAATGASFIPITWKEEDFLLPPHLLVLLPPEIEFPYINDNVEFLVFIERYFPIQLSSVRRDSKIQLTDKVRLEVESEQRERIQRQEERLRRIGEFLPARDGKN